MQSSMQRLLQHLSVFDEGFISKLKEGSFKIYLEVERTGFAVGWCDIIRYIYLLSVPSC